MRDSRSTGGTRWTSRARARRSPTSAPSSTRGSTRTRDELAPRVRAAGHARRADRADATREVDPVRRGLDALRLARARRRARRLADAAHRARRRARRPRPRRPRPLLAHRGARADAHRLRAARARGRGRAAAALGRGDVVPGLLGAGHRQRPRGAAAAAPCPTATPRPRRRGSINGQKVWTSLAQYSDRCVLLDAHRRRPSRATAASPRSSSTWTRPGITVAPIEMINGVREFAEVFFDDVVVPADRMLGEVQRRLGGRDEHPPVRALVVLLAAHRVPLPPARAARRGRARRRPHRRGRRRTRSCSSTRCAPDPAPRSTGSPPARRSARRRCARRRARPRAGGLAGRWNDRSCRWSRDSLSQRPAGRGPGPAL